MGLSESDARLVETQLPSVNFEDLWYGTVDSVSEEERTHLRDVVRSLIGGCLSLECEPTAAALAPHLVNFGISADEAGSVAAKLLDDFQTYLEAIALQGVPEAHVQEVCERVYEYYATPVDRTDFVNSMRTHVNLGTLASLAVANLLFKQWRWNVWWRNASRDIRPLFGDEWAGIATRMATVEAYGLRASSELRWVFLMNEMDGIKSEMENIKSDIASLKVRLSENSTESGAAS